MIFNTCFTYRTNRIIMTPLFNTIFMKNMIATMYQENGIGLASVQVGVLKRVLVMDIDYESDCHHQHHHGEDGGARALQEYLAALPDAAQHVPRVGRLVGG